MAAAHSLDGVAHLRGSPHTSPATARAGDPHFTTFDEQFTKFDFFGVGEYWLMRTIGNVFNVQGRQFKTGKASSNSAAAVSLGGTVVNVFTASELEEPRLTVDGVEVDQAAALPLQVGDITISRQGALRVDSQPESDADMTYEIQHTITADRVRVVVQASPYLVQYLHIYIRASGGSYYNTAGLCGNWNDDRGDDYELPDGSVLNATEPTPAQVHDWAMQWRVTSLANSLFHHNGTTPDDFYDPNWDPVYDPTDLADISFITAAEEQCRGLSLELSYFRACVMDMVQVNDTSLVRAALRAQSENGDLTGINFTTAEDPSAPATATGFTSLVFETQRTTYGDEICLEFPARLPAGLVNDAVLAVHVPQGLAVTSTSLLPPGEDVLQALTAYEGGDPLHADNVTLKVFTDQAACCSAGVRDSAGAAVRATPLSAVTAAFVDMYVQPDGSGGTARDVGVRACMRVLPDSGPEGAGGSYVITASLNFTSASGVAKSTDDAVTNVTLAEPRPQGNATWTWEQPVEAGSQLTVHFTVTNAEEEEEEAALRNVTLVQTPPHGTDYAGGGEVDVTWSGGDAPTSTGSVVVRLVGGRLHVDVGDLDPGRSASLALTFVVNGALPVGEPITLSGTSQVVHNVVPLPSGSDLLDDAALRYTANTTRTGDSALAMELGPRIRGAPTLAVRNSSLRGSSGNSMLPSEGFDFRAVFELTEGAFGDVVLGLLLPASLEFRSCALDFEAHGAHVVSIGDGDSVQGLAARIADAGNYDTAAVSDVAAAIGVDLLHIGGSAAATLGHGNGVRVALRLGDLRNTVDGVTDARDQLALRCRLRHRRAEWLAPAPVVSVVRVNASHAGVQAVEAAAANVTVFGGGPQPNVTAVWSPTDGVPPGHTTTLSLVLTNPATPGGGVYPIFNATVLVVTPEGLRPGSTARANITLRDPSGDEVEGGSVAVAIIGGGSGVRVVFPTLQPGTVATVHLAFTVRVDVSYGGAVVSLGRAVSLTYLDALGEAGRAALEVNATNLGAGALVTPALGQWTASLALYATGLADTTGQELAVGESLTLRATLPLHRGRWPSLNATLAVPAGLRVLGASLVTVGASVTSHQRFEQSGTEAAPLDAESFDLGPAHVTAVANVTDTAGAGASGGPSRGEVAHVSLGDIVVWSDSGAAGTVVVQWRAVVVDAAFVTDGLALDAAPGVAFLALTGPAGAATAEATAAWGGAARLGTVHTPTLVLALQWSSVSGGSLRPGDGVNVTATVGHALGGDTSSAPLQLLLAQETDTAVSRAPAYNVTLRVPLPPYTALATGNVASDVAVAFAGGAVNAVTFAAAGDVTDPLRSPQAGEVRVTLHVMLPLPSLAPSVRVALVTEDGGPLQADVTPGEAQAAYRTAPAPGGDGGRRLLANATALAGLSPTPLLLVNAPLFVRVEEVSSSLAHTAAGTAAVGERVTWELTLEARAGRFNDTVAFLALPPGVSVEEAAVVRHGADVTVTDSAPGESVNLTERAVEIVSWGSPLLPALGADLIPPDATAGDTRSGSVRVVRVALGNLLSTGSGGPPSEVVLRVTGALEDDPAVTRGATLAVGGGVNATAQDDTVEQPVSLRLQADPYRAEVAAPLLLAGVRYLAREGGSAGPLWAATFEVNASAAAAPAFDANVTVTLAAELMLDLAVRDSLPAPLCPFPCAVEPAQMTSGLRVITVRGDPGGGDPQLPPGSGVRITLEVALVDPGAADDPVASSLLDTRVSVDGRAYSGPRSQIPASRRRLYRDEATERLPFSVAPVLSAPWVHASGWNRTSTSLADPGREEASVGEWFVLRCNATISAAAEYSSAVLHALPPSILGTSGSTVAATLLWHRVVRAGGSLQSSAAQEAGEGAFLEARFSGAGQAFVGSAISFPLGTVTAAEALGPGLAADNLTFTVEVGLVVSHTDAPPAVDAAPVLAFPFRLATLDELGTAHAPTANATVEIVRPNATLAASVTVQSDSAPPDPLFTGVSATVDAGAVFLVWVNVTQATAVAGPAFAPRLRIAPPPGENASLELLNATAGDGTPLAAQRGTESALVDAAAVEVVLAAGALRPAGAGDGGSIASAAEPWTVFLRLRVADSVTPAAALRLDSTLRYATAPSVEPAVLASASGNEAGEAKVALAEAALAVRSEASVRVAPTMAPFVSFTAVNSSANITSAPALVYGEVVAYRVRVAFAEGVTPDASVLVVLPAATVVGVGTVSTRHVPLMRGGAVAVERCGSGYAAATCARAGEPPAHAAAASATAAVVSPGATHWAGAAAEADSSAALAAALPGSPLPLPLPGTLPSAAYNTSALLLRFGDVVNAPTNAVSLEEDAVDILVWAAVLQQPRAWELQLSSQLAAPIPSPQAVLLWRPGVVPAPVAAAARETVDGASALPDPLPSPLWDGTAATEPDWALQELRNASAARIVRPLLVTSVRDESDVPLLVDGRVRLLVNVSHAATSSSAAFDVAATVVLPPHVTVRVLETGVIASPPEAGAATVSVSDPRPGSGVTSVTLRVDRIDLSRHLAAVIEGDANDLHVPGADVPAGVCEAFAAVPRGDGAVEPGSPAAAALPAPSEGPPAGNATRCTVAAAGLSTWLAPPATVLSRAEEAETCVAVVTRRCEVASPFDAGGSSPRSDNGTASRRMQEELNAPGSTKMILAAWLNGTTVPGSVRDSVVVGEVYKLRLRTRLLEGTLPDTRLRLVLPRGAEALAATVVSVGSQLRRANGTRGGEPFPHLSTLRATLRRRERYPTVGNGYIDAAPGWPSPGANWSAPSRPVAAAGILGDEGACVESARTHPALAVEACPACTRDTVTWGLGHVLNPGDGARGADEEVVVEALVLVHSVEAVEAGAELAHSADVRFRVAGNDAALTTEAPSVIVREPALALTWSARAPAGLPALGREDGGALLQVVVNITHTPASSAVAYDLLLQHLTTAFVNASARAVATAAGRNASEPFARLLPGTLVVTRIAGGAALGTLRGSGQPRGGESTHRTQPGDAEWGPLPTVRHPLYAAAGGDSLALWPGTAPLASRTPWVAEGVDDLAVPELVPGDALVVNATLVTTAETAAAVLASAQSRPAGGTEFSLRVPLRLSWSSSPWVEGQGNPGRIGSVPDVKRLYWARLPAPTPWKWPWWAITLLCVGTLWALRLLHALGFLLLANHNFSLAAQRKKVRFPHSPPTIPLPICPFHTHKHTHTHTSPCCRSPLPRQPRRPRRRPRLLSRPPRRRRPLVRTRRQNLGRGPSLSWRRAQIATRHQTPSRRSRKCPLPAIRRSLSRRTCHRPRRRLRLRLSSPMARDPPAWTTPAPCSPAHTPSTDPRRRARRPRSPSLRGKGRRWRWRRPRLCGPRPTRPSPLLPL